MAEPTQDDREVAELLMSTLVGIEDPANAAVIAQALADFRVKKVAEARAESVVCVLDQEGVLRRPMGASRRADETVRRAARHIIAKALMGEGSRGQRLDNAQEAHG